MVYSGLDLHLRPSVVELSTHHERLVGGAFMGCEGVDHGGLAIRTWDLVGVLFPKSGVLFPLGLDVFHRFSRAGLVTPLGLVGWLVGRLVGWLVGWLAGWLAGWLVGWLVVVGWLHL